MHDRLSDVLGESVVGEIVRLDGEFHDAGRGRVVLTPLTKTRVAELLSRLMAHFPAATVEDRLFLSDPKSLVRGMVRATIPNVGGDGTYVLEIGAAAIFSFYERRFWVSAEQTGNLGSLLCEGLGPLFEQGIERPLRVLSRYDELRELALETLDRAVQAAGTGRDFDPSEVVGELGARLRRAFRLIPHPLREKVQAAQAVPQTLVPHEDVLSGTVIVAVDSFTCKTIWSYRHEHRPLENYLQTLAWLYKIMQSLKETYPEPQGAITIGRASSSEAFCEAFPFYRGIVGTRPDGESGKNS